MNSHYVTCIETVIVEVNGRALDGVSFTSADKADAYKRSVRRWAIERAVIARVFSQVMEVSRKEYEPQPLDAPAFALA